MYVRDLKRWRDEGRLAECGPAGVDPQGDNFEKSFYLQITLLKDMTMNSHSWA